MADYDKNGCQIPDPTPVAIPVGFKKPEDLGEMIARLVRLESARANQMGAETFEEADDFDTDDEKEITTQYQVSEMREDRPEDGKGLTGKKPLPTLSKNAPEPKAAAQDPEYEAFKAWKAAQANEGKPTPAQ